MGDCSSVASPQKLPKGPPKRTLVFQRKNVIIHLFKQHISIGAADKTVIVPHNCRPTNTTTDLEVLHVLGVKSAKAASTYRRSSHPENAMSELHGAVEGGVVVIPAGLSSRSYKYSVVHLFNPINPTLQNQQAWQPTAL